MNLDVDDLRFITALDRAAQGTEAFDVVVSIGAIPDSRWVAHRIAPSRRILCASPAYLRQAPPLQIPVDLVQHACLVLRENAEDDGETIRQWCVAGKGIMLRSEWDVAEGLATGTLVPLLPHYRAPDADITALVPQSRIASTRARLFTTALKQAFRPRPPWRPA
ncbi:hypothetical protein IMZ29_07845 [Achromobacter sp. GG226]|uniref:LysR substrate-binding domain-containing protein n=1 Tax=Verticiella alkaliphila TaxID=2779529 RepID=UPI001C0B31CD|nr:LysR substrate-binding domain-containing protein [Verticiella sp. GG226]MBU4610453.1 hypothetical protein [Verticiella sp. GG226]